MYISIINSKLLSEDLGLHRCGPDVDPQPQQLRGEENRCSETHPATEQAHSQPGEHATVSKKSTSKARHLPGLVRQTRERVRGKVPYNNLAGSSARERPACMPALGS